MTLLHLSSAPTEVLDRWQASASAARGWEPSDWACSEARTLVSSLLGVSRRGELRRQAVALGARRADSGLSLVEAREDLAALGSICSAARRRMDTLLDGMTIGWLDGWSVFLSDLLAGRDLDGDSTTAYLVARIREIYAAARADQSVVVGSLLAVQVPLCGDPVIDLARGTAVREALAFACCAGETVVLARPGLHLVLSTRSRAERESAIAVLDAELDRTLAPSVRGRHQRHSHPLPLDERGALRLLGELVRP